MIELPEATTLARQIAEGLAGRRIVQGIRGNSPHKFAFYSAEPEEYERVLAGKTISGASVHGSNFAVHLDPGYALVLGGGGERVLHHPAGAALPKKHQLLLRFDDGSHLSVSVQGWGAVQLVPTDDLPTRSHAGPPRLGPLDDDFTYDSLHAQFAAVPPEDKRSIKLFVISDPGIHGVGNGYLQDILFLAKVHPRRRAAAVTAKEQGALHKAVKTVLTQAVQANGRDVERDLYNQPGAYVRLLDSRTAGTPCPECSTLIEKQAFLGGAIYFCPQCQT